MKKIAFLIAAAGCLLTAPAALQPASAETSVRIGVNDGWRHDAYRSRAHVVVTRPQCRTVTVRTKRPNGTIIIKKQRRCY